MTSERDDATPIRHSETGEEMTKAERIFVRLSILQTVLAVAGIFTGVVALYAALSEADAVRKQQAASVLPEIVVARSQVVGEEEGRFEWNAYNWGIGPGRVRAVRVTYQGMPARNWRELLSMVGVEGISYNQSQFAGRTLPAAREAEMIFRTTDRDAAIRLRDADVEIDFAVCYCSVFDACWMMPGSIREEPARVNECPDFGDEAFQQ